MEKVSGGGELQGWGWGGYGQLAGGLFSMSPQPIPNFLESINKSNDNDDIRIIQIVASGRDYSGHSFVLTSLGRVYAFGENTSLQLGIEEEGASQNEPKSVVIPEGLKIKQVASGTRHTLFLTEVGTVYSCGEYRFGALGMGKKSPPVDQKSLELIKFPEGDKITFIAAGDTHSAAITDQGSVYFWGNNSLHQLGIYNNLDDQNPSHKLVYFFEPQQLKSELLLNSKPIKITCGDSHNLILLDNGELLGFGWNPFGQVGPRSLNNLQSRISNYLHSISSLNAHLGNFGQIQDIASGFNHNLILNTKGEVFAFGCNKSGECAQPEQVDFVEVAMKINTSNRTQSIVAGGGTSVIIDEEGTPYAWGRCDKGQLGIGKQVDAGEPQITKLDMSVNNNKTCRMISVSGGHSIAWFN